MSANVEYDLREFRDYYPRGSIGWENRRNHADYLAKKWVNERAAEGWRVSRIESSHAGCIVVCMERALPVGDEHTGGES